MLKDLTIGQYIPGNSFIHGLDPRTKILGTLIFTGTVLVAQSFPGMGLAAAIVLGTALVARVPLAYLLRGVRPLWLILVLTFALHAFATPGQILWQKGSFTVTREGLEMGLLITLRLALLVVGTSLLTLTTSSVALTDGLERLLRPLRPLGVPAHELAMMLTIALRFVPTLLEETDKIIKAQTARGADFGQGGLVAGLRHMVPITVPLVVGVFRRAEDLSLAMEARGYRGGEHRTRLRELKMEFRDYLVLLLLIGVLVLILTMDYFN